MTETIHLRKRVGRQIRTWEIKRDEGIVYENTEVSTIIIHRNDAFPRALLFYGDQRVKKADARAKRMIADLRARGFRKFTPKAPASIFRRIRS